MTLKETKKKYCRCTVDDVMRLTRKCSHGWDFDTAVETTADKMRGIVEEIRKLSHSTKLGELLNEMVYHIGEVEADAQEWFDDWHSVCEGRVEDQKDADERDQRDYERIAELDRALAAANEDRRALLAKLGLTDREWSMRGGRSFTDVEV